MRTLLSLLFVLSIISCKKEDSKDIIGSIYPEEAVAASKDGAISLLDEGELSKSWEKRMDGAKLSGFEVAKGKTEGDVAEDFYMVVARTDEGIMVASLLEKKGDKFFFSTPGPEGGDSYLLVICKGECSGGCLPVVKSANGEKRVICSSCADCTKNELEVF